MKTPGNTSGAILKPFICEGRRDVFLIILFCLINGIVLINAVIHDPRIGYDSIQHLDYVRSVSEFRLPAPEDTHEFFSPPLPYILPGLFMSITGADIFWTGKAAQFVNFFLSVALVWILLETCRLISPRRAVRLGALLILGSIPVYYKTFAFVRGEPYAAFFAVATVYFLVIVFIRGRTSTGSVLGLGLTVGLLGISRQWGALLLPAVYIFAGGKIVFNPEFRGAALRRLLAAFLISLALGSSFYMVLKYKHGGLTAFNRPSAKSFSIRNQPASFYFDLGLGRLFSNPIRPAFPNRLVPIFYSETWGDYWGYFIVYGTDTRKGSYVTGASSAKHISKGERPAWLKTNYETLGPYLGRVNAVSLLPSLFLLAAIAFAVRTSLGKKSGENFDGPKKDLSIFLLLSVFISFAGLFWFLIMYPHHEEGDTIKASYLLQVLPMLAILAGLLLDRIEARSRTAYRAIAAAMAMVLIHNLPATISRYSMLHRLFD